MQKFFNNIEDLEKILNDSEKVFLVSGNNSYIDSGAKKFLEPILKKRKVVYFKKTSSNPTLEEIKKATKLYKEQKCDYILAIGGGSVIDTAKAVFILSAQKDNPETAVKSNNTPDQLKGKFIAVPTTAGSGAESTHFAVIYMNGQKYSLAHKKALANIVILDSRLTYSLPPHTTATSGMDAITQAVESYWSIQSTELSRGLSKKALEKLLPNIEDAVLKPTPESRSAMLNGANLAGQAINIAKTTACHALSYGLTINYRIPHGHAVALTLPYFIEFNTNITNEDCQDNRGVEFVRARMQELLQMLEVVNPTAAKNKIELLMDKIGLERKLTDINIGQNEVELLIKGVNKERIKNNPRALTQHNIGTILADVFPSFTKAENCSC